MDYYVIAHDGQQYGPASVDTLKDWAAQGRLAPTTTLKDASTGQTLQAAQVPGLFAAPQPGAPSPAPAAPVPSAYDPVLAPGYQQPPQPQPQPAGPYAQPPGPYAQAPGPYAQQQAPYAQQPYPHQPQGQWAQPASYNRAMAANDFSADRAELMGVVIRVCIALFLVVVFRYAGLITSIFACYYAFTNASGNRYGVAMVVMAVLCLAIVGATWLFRFHGLIAV